MTQASATADKISQELDEWEGSLGDFVAALDNRGIEFLSYTKLKAVEFCEYRYLLEYVEGVTPRKSPGMEKGRVFHEAAAELCTQIEEDGWDLDEVDRLIDKAMDEEDGRHLRNALELLIENLPTDHRLVAVEEPFVLDLGEDLPPLLGVIDLVLRKGRTFFVVDHKTGKKFYDQDGMQLRLYREHVRRVHGASRCRMAFDEYRWVNNLARIRVPAFRRTEMLCGGWSWAGVLTEIRHTYREMTRIQEGGDASAHGPCYMCLVSSDCPRRSTPTWW